MLDSMNFKPFIFGCGSGKAFKITAGVKTLAAPVGGREDGDGYFGPVWHTGTPVGIIHGVLECGLGKVFTVFKKFGVVQFNVAANGLAGDTAFGPSLA